MSGHHHIHHYSVVVGLCFVAAVALLVSTTTAAKAARRDTTSEKKILSPENYNEVIDLVADVARETCHTLGRLITDPNFDYRLRCDLLIEMVEDLSGISDSMVREIKLTQKQMVENAIDGRYDQDLIPTMKTVSKKVLSNKTTTEQIVQVQLNKDMSQWVLDVSVHVKGKPRKSSSSRGGNAGLSLADFRKMPAATRQQLRSMGMTMPDEDAIEELNEAPQGALIIFVNDDDREWARDISRKLKRQKKAKWSEKKKTLSVDEMRADL